MFHVEHEKEIPILFLKIALQMSYEQDFGESMIWPE